ncbi:sodium channel, voltage-gated, type I, beta a [Trichomycterus rosablanca]|uniref:sodium channel, voltage-gated, type I, beta a n=1 Tax=Trichomycterus rosablanca TaxID=2290929 RepID=UPI002F35D3D3
MCTRFLSVTVGPWVKMAVVEVVTLSLMLCVMHARLGGAACVEVDSETEAVVGKEFKLSCIFCKLRGEVQARASVEWNFRGEGEDIFTPLYRYSDMGGKMKGVVLDERFEGRLKWAGTKDTPDLQDGSLSILNVTYNDTGMYHCFFERFLIFPNHEQRNFTNRHVNLTVVAKVTRTLASILSEVMMYVSIIGLQFWLLVEMVYCYRKIAAAGEEALRESAAEYLAITTDSKDNCTSVAVAEQI